MSCYATITANTKFYVYYDTSGTIPEATLKDTVDQLKTLLEDEYGVPPANVTETSTVNERWVQHLDQADDEYVVIIFTNEADPDYHTTSDSGPTAEFTADYDAAKPKLEAATRARALVYGIDTDSGATMIAFFDEHLPRAVGGTNGYPSAPSLGDLGVTYRTYVPEDRTAAQYLLDLESYLTEWVGGGFCEPIRVSVRESVGPIIAATSHVPSDVSVSMEFFRGAELTTGRLHPIAETLSPGQVVHRVYPAPEQSDGSLNRYAGTTKLSRMETSFPAGIATRVQDVTALSGDLIDIGDGEGAIYVTPQDLIDYIFSLWASEFDWFTYATVPDLRLKVRAPSGSGNATPAQYSADATLGRAPCPTIMFPQDDDNELTMRQILDELLSPFPGTIPRQNSSGQIEIVPTYGPDADATPAVTLTDSDVILVSEGKGDPRTIKNAAVVESQPFTREEDVGALIDAWFQFTSDRWSTDDNDQLFTTGTGTYLGITAQDGTLIQSDYPKVWPVDSSRIPDGPIQLVDSLGNQLVSIDWQSAEGDSGSFATIDTLNEIPRDGTVVTAIQHSEGGQSATIKGKWLDADEGGPGVKLWVDEEDLRTCGFLGISCLTPVWRITLADATTAWTRDALTATGEFSLENGDFLEGASGANALELSETAFGKRTSRISITGYGIQDGSLLTEIAEAHVRHTINPQLVRDVRQSTWRAFPIKFDHIGRLVELPSSEQGVVLARNYGDDMGGVQADGSINCTIRVEVRDGTGEGAIDLHTEYLMNDDGSPWRNDDGTISEVL